ncbi:TetR/AcrR family transcriptional regulator [Caballeronia sordidicola]|uniref:TetR/AcrR family transcriptional regulator n=1 Tax=Caballeronia sordidicola TaxID=196367 RepID=UPI000AD78315|nr:TetR/AcrR family transcriptional regulator [Caballeronia sordidicola]
MFIAYMTQPKTLPSRRPPSSVKSEQRIKDILLVARQVFSERGYASATTIDMARRLGVSEGTVFTYFSGKRDLCVRVICDWYDEIIAEIEATLPHITGTRAKLSFLIRTHLYRLMIDGPGLCALILSEGRAKDDTFGDEIVQLQRRYTAPLMQVLSDGVAAGDIRDDLPLSLLRSSIYGPMEHVLWDAIAKKTVDIEETSKRLSLLLWQGLQPPNQKVVALGQLHRDVAGALRAFEEAFEDTPTSPE